MFVYILLLGILVLGSFKYLNFKANTNFILGGIVKEVDIKLEDINTTAEGDNVEKYFRPSNLPILNDKKDSDKLINDYYDKNVDKIVIPKNLIDTAENTILNYFSLLREAANPVDNKYTGCGSLGTGQVPYKIAYTFFCPEYQKKVSFKKYKSSFENILHINLIKLKAVPQVSSNSNSSKFFYEIETIQGSETGVGYFAYYYGFITLEKVDGAYKICDISITPQQYLCAPYHSWFYDGESSVSIKYGNWCNLVKEIKDVKIDGFTKDVYFKGTDNNDYKIEFYTLTNDYDIEVAQYKKNSEYKWVLINLNPNDCLN